MNLGANKYEFNDDQKRVFKQRLFVLNTRAYF